MESSPIDLALLDTRREGALRWLGEPNPDVVSRLVPSRTPWPASALGGMRVVRRASDTLLVTSGLSNPYDPSLHAKPPEVPLDYELCLSVVNDHPSTASDATFASSIWPQLLYALADIAVEDWIDLRAPLRTFLAITIQSVIGHGFGKGYEKDGRVGYLIGMPFDGDDFDRHLYLNGFYQGLSVPYADAAVGYFPVKVLRPSELAWAMAEGNDGAMKLAWQFLERGDGCRNDDRLPPLH